MDDHSLNLMKAAFKHHPDLQQRVLHAAKTSQDAIPQLLRDITTFIITLQYPGQIDVEPALHKQPPTEPTAKKRKLEQPSEAASTENGSHDISSTPNLNFECKDVSFTSPLRKKLRLQFVSDTTNALVRQIRLINQATDAVEYTLRAEDIDAIFCLPVPEKVERQHCFVVFPLPGSQNDKGAPAEPLVWTMNNTNGALQCYSDKSRMRDDEDDSLVDITRRELDHFMAVLSESKTVLSPDAREFASEIPQSHRKGEKALHTKAFRGSKEGYLYLLSTGIIFGFKKPVTYFPFSTIESISFTSVLQRTFNIVITTSSTDPSDPEKKTEHELSMVDQADFQPIDAYIRAHGLNDASMAAERRAKIHNVNKPAEVEANGEGEIDGRGEIEKAEEALQDQEDEEEEDYDPSGGESEGSGEDSEEDGEEGEGRGYEDGEEEEEEWDEDEEVGAEEEGEEQA